MRADSDMKGKMNMARRMTIGQPVLNVVPNRVNGPILGHTLELIIPATVTAGGPRAHRIEAPAFAWWETITFWDLGHAGWVQRVPARGPVDQALGQNNTANFWRERYAGAVGDRNWNPAWGRNPTNREAEEIIARNGLSWHIRVYDNPGLNNPRYRNVPGAPRNVARSVEFGIRVGTFLIRKTQILVSSVRGDRQEFLDGTYVAADVLRRLP